MTAETMLHLGTTDWDASIVARPGADEGPSLGRSGHGKKRHHCMAVDERGESLLSRQVCNDEPALLELNADVLELSEDARGCPVGG